MHNLSWHFNPPSLEVVLNFPALCWNTHIGEFDWHHIFYVINQSGLVGTSVASEPRLGSARAIFQKARIEKNWQNEPIWGLWA